MSTIRSYAEACAYLGAKGERPLAHNTRIYKREDGAIGIRLHETEVITYTQDGRTILYSGGWLTHTTKERLNNFAPEPFRVWQERGQWSLYNWRTREAWPWAEGITIDADGTVYNAGAASERDRIRKLTRDVQKYVQDYAEALFAGKLAAPDGGDCWACAFKLDGDSEHIRLHLEEHYLVPSLLTRAVEAYPVSIIARGRIATLWGYTKEGEGVQSWADPIAREQVKSSLARYLKRALGIAR